jgi:hypothetical protein
MNGSYTRPFAVRRFVIVVAVLYGVSIGWFVIPRLVGVVVPETLRAVRHSAYSVNLQNSACRAQLPSRFVLKSRALAARLWNDFQ